MRLFLGLSRGIFRVACIITLTDVVVIGKGNQTMDLTACGARPAVWHFLGARCLRRGQLHERNTAAPAEIPGSAQALHYARAGVHSVASSILR
ncbi:hypothetical protein KCP77_24785 (plasmid) [Salmonella enterica subsp. enterica]|nr:hypothetical protein KCP77_24785 [Salmonella enterica subsp. enterica]